MNKNNVRTVNSFKNMQNDELNRYKKKVWRQNLSEDFDIVKKSVRQKKLTLHSKSSTKG